MFQVCVWDVTLCKLFPRYLCDPVTCVTPSPVLPRYLCVSGRFTQVLHDVVPACTFRDTLTGHGLVVKWLLWNEVAIMWEKNTVVDNVAQNKVKHVARERKEKASDPKDLPKR